MKRFPCRPCGADFIDSAPMRVVNILDLSVPREQVWAELNGSNALKWSRLVSGVDWTSPGPLGVGSTCFIRIGFGALTLNERYFRWEEGVRKSFFVVDANLPMFDRLAEDYLLEVTSPSTCRFTWTIGAQLKPWARPTQSLNRMMLNILARDTGKHFGTTH